MALPYQGNKQSIANDLILFLRNSFIDINNFYDLFGGGGNITEVAIKYFNNVHYNEILPHVYCAFNSLIEGTFEQNLPKSEWISREQFKEACNMPDCARKGLILTCWSFGNNQRSYIYGADIEDWKQALHNICFANNKVSIEQSIEIMQKRDFGGYTIEFDNETIDYLLSLPIGSDRRYALKKCVKNRINLQSLERLERLQSLERLERLQSLERLETTNLSYEAVNIKPNSLVYCDIPYNTKYKHGNYRGGFDHENFYNWSLNNENTVVFSDYLENIPSDFTIIWKKYKRNILGENVNKKEIEVLAWNGKGNFNKSTLF